MTLEWILVICGIALAVLFCLCLAIANFAPERFMDIYKECNEKQAESDYTPSEIVNIINFKEFGGKLKIERTDRYAGDAYVRGGWLILSDITLQSRGIAAYATLTHELGHALQDRDTKKLKLKSILMRIGMIIGPLLFPALIAGLILIAIGGNLFYWGIGVAAFGGLIFLLAVTLRCITISIEKDASKKAMVMLKDYLNKKDLKIAKKLLNSAKLTYWAVLFRTLLGWTFLTKKPTLFN